jgi:hypothetical protein
MKDVQDTEEAFSPRKRIPSTSRYEFSSIFSTFVGHFCPLGFSFGFSRPKSQRIHANPDPHHCLQVQILPCSRAGSGSDILGKKSVRIRIPAARLPDGSSDIVCCTLQPLCFPSLVGTVSLMSWIRKIKILKFSRTGSVPGLWHFVTDPYL